MTMEDEDQNFIEEYYPISSCLVSWYISNGLFFLFIEDSEIKKLINQLS